MRSFGRSLRCASFTTHSLNVRRHENGVSRQFLLPREGPEEMSCFEGPAIFRGSNPAPHRTRTRPRAYRRRQIQHASLRMTAFEYLTTKTFPVRRRTSTSIRPLFFTLDRASSDQLLCTMAQCCNASSRRAMTWSMCTHIGTNTGETPTHVILVEMKQPVAHAQQGDA